VIGWPTPRVDYDLTNIAATYDRGHDHGPAVLEQWMATIASHVDPAGVRTILDLACGTGKFMRVLSERFDATVIGIDPSQKMLRVAQHSNADCGRVALAFGTGEALPLREQSVDMVFVSMVFHHFEDPVPVARECARVLRTGGCVCLRTITFEQIPNYPYLPFFPASRPLLEQRLPTLSATCAAFEAASLRTVYAGIVMQEIAPDYATYAQKLSSGADTTLARLDSNQFSSGLESILAKHADGGPPMPIIEPIDFVVFGKA
jgi:ubiquinone/menaquinone biosynthesis C-methylase UbiE